MKEELKFFSAQLKKTREERGMSQVDLSKKADVQLRMCSKYETGEAAPTLPVIVRMAKALDVSADYLMSPDYVDPSNIGDKKLLSFMEKIDKLDHQTKFVVKEILESVLAKQELRVKEGLRLY